MKSINRYTFFLWCLFTFSTAVFSQNTIIDSLETKLQNHKAKDTIRVNLLNELAFSINKKNFEQSMAYIKESEFISDSIGFKKGKARSLYLKATAHRIPSNFESVFQYMYEALDLYKSINYKPGISECYNGLGLLFYNKGEQKQAIEYYKKSVSISEAIGNSEAISTSLNSIGIAYSEVGNYAEAIHYYKRALKISKEIKNENRIARCLSNIGSVYNEQGNYPHALEYHNKSLLIDEKLENSLGVSKSLNNIGIIYKNLQNYDKAIASYEKALKIQKNHGNKKNITEILNNLGNVYKKKQDYKTALKYLGDALKLSEEINNKMYIATILNNIGDVHLKLNNYSFAFEYFIKAKKINLEVENQRGLCNSYLGIATVFVNQENYYEALNYATKSQQISNKLELIDYQRDVSKLLVEIYKKTNQPKKALSSHEQFKILNDSLFNKESIEKIAQIEYEYKYKQQLDSASIRELKLTKTVQSTSQDLEKSKRNYLWAIIGVLLVSILLGAIIFYQKLRNEKSKTQNIVMEQKLLRSQMTPHFIFNSLSVLQGMILNKEEKKSIHYLSKFSKLLRITLENSRDKTVSLSQELTAVQDYLTLQNLENEAYKCTILVEDSIEIPLFEIPPMLIQPFVENAIEHAFVNQKEDRRIDIRLTYLDKKLICTIADNGIGINFKSKNINKDKKSLATTITSERLKVLSKDFKMQGSVTIEDRQKFNQKGTLVTLVIPHKLPVKQ